LKIAFLGSIPLAVRCLRYLAEQKDIEIVAVVTRPRGLPRWWEPPDVIDVAEEERLPAMEMQNLKDKNIDVIFVVGYEKILKKDIISIPQQGVINTHLAPLPEYRGRNSPSHAIMNGETRYGVTIHYIDEGIDTGPIISRADFDIEPDMTARELYQRSEEVALALFKDTLPRIIDGTVTATPQSGGKYYYDKNSLANNEVDFSWPPERIYNFVRGMTFPPFEGPYIHLRGKKFYLSIK